MLRAFVTLALLLAANPTFAQRLKTCAQVSATELRWSPVQKTAAAKIIDIKPKNAQKLGLLITEGGDFTLFSHQAGGRGVTLRRLERDDATRGLDDRQRFLDVTPSGTYVLWTYYAATRERSALLISQRVLSILGSPHTNTSLFTCGDPQTPPREPSTTAPPAEAGQPAATQDAGPPKSDAGPAPPADAKPSE